MPFRYQRAIRRADGRVSDEDEAEVEDDDGLGINDRSLLLGESLTASYRIRGSARRRNISPESAVSLWSKLTFSWPYRLLRQGTRSGILNSGQAMQLPHDLKLIHVTNEFDVSEFVRPIPLYTGQSSTTRLDQAGLDTMKSLLSRILSVYGFKITMFGIFEFILAAATFAMPFLLSQLLQYMEGATKDIRIGFTWAGLIVGVSIIDGLVSVHLDYAKNRLSLSIRSVLMSAVYEKSTLISKSGLSGRTVGEILNLMSTDCDRVSGTIQNIHQLWSVPLRCIATLILLYYQIGYIFFIGLGFSIIMIFINQYIGNFIGRVNKDFMAAKDKRIRLVTDIIFSMKQIKMQAWESIFGQKINELRKNELNELRLIFRYFTDWSANQKPFT